MPGMIAVDMDIFYCPSGRQSMRHSAEPCASPSLDREYRHRSCRCSLQMQRRSQSWYPSTQGGLDGLRLLDRNNAVLTNLVDSFGNDFAEAGVVVCRTRCNLCDHWAFLHIFRELLDLLDGNLNCPLNPALHGHWIGTCRHRLHTFAEYGVS